MARVSVTAGVLTLTYAEKPHAFVPPSALRQYSVWSPPTYTHLLSLERAGDDVTGASVAKDHIFAPVSPASAYTDLSSQPTYTAPSGPMVGGDSKARVEE